MIAAVHKDEFDAALIEGFRRSTAQAYRALTAAQKDDAGARVGAVVRRRPCPLCADDSSPPSLHAKQGLEVVRCPRCAMVYSRVIFDEAADRAFYDRSAFQGSYLALKRNDAYAALERRKCRYIVACASRHVPHARRLLEIGSGAGRLLEAGRDAGWSVLGIEPSPDFAREARSRGLEVLEGWFPQSLPPERGSFDVVALLDVIEHAADPIGLLRAVRERLAPGGVVALQAPNYDSLLLRLEGDASAVICHGHWNYFDPGSLERCATQAGLRKLELETIISELDRIAEYPAPRMGTAALAVRGALPPPGGPTAQWLHEQLMGFKLFGLFAGA